MTEELVCCSVLLRFEGR